MNFNNVRIPNVPGGGAASALIRAGIIGGLGIYGLANILYNVDGGHRAIVFNRIYCIKDKGEAKSAQLNGHAIANNPAFITLRRIEASREIAHTIANSGNKVFLNSDDLLLNLQQLVSDTTLTKKGEAFVDRESLRCYPLLLWSSALMSKDV